VLALNVAADLVEALAKDKLVEDVFGDAALELVAALV
jgi:hypothetical protein